MLAIAAIVNQAKSPVLLAGPKEAIDLLSLSYDLKPKVEIQLLPQANLPQFYRNCIRAKIYFCSIHLKKLAKPGSSRSLDRRQSKFIKPKLLIADEISLSLWSVKNAKSRCLVEG